MKETAELLAKWRSATRDTQSAIAAARIAKLALETISSIDAAADEVEAAARAALEAVDRARIQSAKVRAAAVFTTEQTSTMVAGAEGDLARANYEVVTSEIAESAAQEAYQSHIQGKEVGN